MLVEAAVMIPIIFVFVLGSVDFLFALYQWNAASKAAQLGARIAAVSNSVASDLNSLSVSVLSSSVLPGDTMPTFVRTCDGATATCSGGSTNTYDATAMSVIVYGRSGSACGDATDYYQAGMCDFFGRVTPANVVIKYEQTGLGYAGRPGGPVPTITLTLQNIPFQFFFLGGLMGFANLQIPAMTTTITGEDLSSNAP